MPNQTLCFNIYMNGEMIANRTIDLFVYIAKKVTHQLELTNMQRPSLETLPLASRVDDPKIRELAHV